MRLLALLGFCFPLVDAKVSPLRIQGTVSAVFTPYHSNGTLNLLAVPEQARYLKETGVKGVFVGGTTGDSLALTLAERKALATAWAPAAKANNLIFIVHVGAEALGEAVELTRHAHSLGAAAVGCMASVFFKPSNVEALALWLKEVGRAAPSLPLYYYHIPSMTGVVLKMLPLLQAIEKAGIPNFVGVKYTGLYETQAFMDFEACTRYRGGHYEIFCGREEMTLEALSVGAKGFIGSQFNYAGDLYNDISRAWHAGNLTFARELQAAAQGLVYMENAAPEGVNGNRLMMQSTPIDIGPSRLPSLPADEKTAKETCEFIEKWCKEGGVAALQRARGKPIAMCLSRSPCARRAVIV